MEQLSPSRVEVIMAGIGGMGVLMAGQLLSWAAIQRYEYISWAPSYAVARRGGLCECTVVCSHEEIASPLLDQAQALLIFEGSQFKTFEHRVRPGGIIIVECAGLKDEPSREDYRLLKVAGMEIAIDMGEAVVNNLILLGVFIEMMDTVPPEFIEIELDKRYGKKEAVLARNKKAFKKGLELGRTLQV